MSETTLIVCIECHSVNRVPWDRLNQNPICGKCKQSLFQGKPIELDEFQFEFHVSRSGIPIVADFWAPWCGPCRMMAPAFAQAAAQLEPNFRLVKVNTEIAQGLAATFRIQAIPTLILFNGNREISRQQGAMTLPQLMNWIRSTAH